jgi:hypothetical protein
MVAARNAAASNDFPNEVCRKFQRCANEPLPQQCRSVRRWTPQVSTMRAAAANDRRRMKCRNRVPQKNRQKKPPGKDWHLGVGSLGSRERVWKLSRSPCLSGVTGHVRLPMRSGAARRTAIARPIIGPRFNRLSI